MIKVSNVIEVYDSESPSAIEIKSHAYDKDKIVLVVDGKRYIILAKDLRLAIENATNCSKY